jgi:ion channel-forming bestrophin family protein
MIVRPRPHAGQLFYILRGSVVPRILGKLLAITVLSAAVVALNKVFPGRFPDYTAAPFTLLGLALSIFLSFRNSACYDRWAEGRRQWGQLIVELRSLGRQIVTLLDQSTPGAEALRQRILRRAIAYPYALAASLRGTAPDPGVAQYLDPEEYARVMASQNPPDALLREMAADLVLTLRQQRVSDIVYQGLAGHLNAVAGIQAACERIRHTPLPFAYTLLLHRTAYLFCLLLPFGLVDNLGYATPLVTAIVAYTFFGLDELGDELEEPFGVAENDLPLNAMARTVEINLLEALGETTLPAPLLPKNYILL